MRVMFFCQYGWHVFGNACVYVDLLPCLFASLFVCLFYLSPMPYIYIYIYIIISCIWTRISTSCVFYLHIKPRQQQKTHGYHSVTPYEWINTCIFACIHANLYSTKYNITIWAPTLSVIGSCPSENPFSARDFSSCSSCSFCAFSSCPPAVVTVVWACVCVLNLH